MINNMANSRWNENWKKTVSTVCVFCALLFVTQNCLADPNKTSTVKTWVRADEVDDKLVEQIKTIKQTDLSGVINFPHQLTKSELAEMPDFKGSDALLQTSVNVFGKAISQPLERLIGRLPGQLLIKNCFDSEHNIKPQGILTIAPGSTISRDCLLSMAQGTELFLNKNMPEGVTPIAQPVLISSFNSYQVTAGLILSVPARVLIEPILGSPGTYKMVQGAVEKKRPILVFGIAAINQGNDSVSMSCHKQMLKNMFCLALSKGIEKLTILPPGSGTFGVNREAMILLMANVLSELKLSGRDISNFVVYLHPIGAESFSRKAFANKGLMANLCIISGKDIVLTANVLAQKDGRPSNAQASVATVDLLNPDPLTGSGELAYGWTPVDLSAQGMSAITTVEVASQCRNPNVYTELKTL